VGGCILGEYSYTPKAYNYNTEEPAPVSEYVFSCYRRR
jgi:hypothetical protein